MYCVICIDLESKTYRISVTGLKGNEADWIVSNRNRDLGPNLLHIKCRNAPECIQKAVEEIGDFSLVEKFQ